jgi:hypothetical protein
MQSPRAKRPAAVFVCITDAMIKSRHLKFPRLYFLTNVAQGPLWPRFGFEAQYLKYSWVRAMNKGYGFRVTINDSNDKLVCRTLLYFSEQDHHDFSLTSTQFRSPTLWTQNRFMIIIIPRRSVEHDQLVGYSSCESFNLSQGSWNTSSGSGAFLDTQQLIWHLIQFVTHLVHIFEF